MNDERKIAGYRVDEFGVLVNAPCGCWQCSAEGWQRGHPYCDNVPAELLALEEKGIISRHLDGSWYWKLNEVLPSSSDFRDGAQASGFWHEVREERTVRVEQVVGNSGVYLIEYDAETGETLEQAMALFLEIPLGEREAIAWSTELDKKVQTLDRFEDLVGHTLKKVENIHDEKLVFTLANGDRYMLYHSQDCCESVTIDDIVGDLDDLVGVPILRAEEVSSEDEGARGEWDDHFTWTFYKLATIKGYVDVKWYGTSNGYYSERVDWGKA